MVLTLHSFVYPPEPSIHPAATTQSSFSLLKLELTPEVLMHLSTPHTVHKDTYVVCRTSGQESRGLGKWNEIGACGTGEGGRAR